MRRNGSRRVAVSVVTNRGEVGELPKETATVQSAPRVIITPDFLIRRTVLARQHRTTIGHSWSHKAASDRWNPAHPNQIRGGSRGASARQLARRVATAMQPRRGFFGVAHPSPRLPDLLICSDGPRKT